MWRTKEQYIDEMNKLNEYDRVKPSKETTIRQIAAEMWPSIKSSLNSLDSIVSECDIAWDDWICVSAYYRMDAKDVVYASHIFMHVLSNYFLHNEMESYGLDTWKEWRMEKMLKLGKDFRKLIKNFSWLNVAKFVKTLWDN